jgi:hypothetical protein
LASWRVGMVMTFGCDRALNACERLALMVTVVRTYVCTQFLKGNGCVEKRKVLGILSKCNFTHGIYFLPLAMVKWISFILYIHPLVSFVIVFFSPYNNLGARRR